MAGCVGNAGWKLEGPSDCGASSGGVGTISGLGGRFRWTSGDDIGMLRGERSKTVTGDDGETARRGAELWAGGGDFATKPFVRAHVLPPSVKDFGADGVSSSDSVKSMKQASSPLTADVVAAANAVADVVVAGGAGGGWFRGVSTSSSAASSINENRFSADYSK